MAQGKFTATTTKQLKELGFFMRSGFIKNNGSVDVKLWLNRDGGGDEVLLRAGQAFNIKPWSTGPNKIWTDRIWHQVDASTCDCDFVLTGE